MFPEALLGGNEDEGSQMNWSPEGQADEISLKRHRALMTADSECKTHSLSRHIRKSLQSVL